MFLLQSCIFTNITRIVPIEAKRIFKDFQVSVMCYPKISVTCRQAVKQSDKCRATQIWPRNACFTEEHAYRNMDKAAADTLYFRVQFILSTLCTGFVGILVYWESSGSAVH